MKKSLIALAVLAAAGTASAQSSVTLFGVVDATLQRLSNSGGPGVTRLTNSGLSSSSLGFRGVEDLGGGMSASFWLEADVKVDDGTSTASNTNNQASGGPLAGINGGQGLTFNRRSTVSLAGEWGEVRAGRDYTPQFRNLSAFDPFGVLGVGTTQTLNSIITGTTAVRASNSVAYWLPSTLGGLYGTYMHYRGENLSGAATSSDGNGNGVRVGWATGPFNVALALSKTKYAAGDVKQNNIAGSWDFGVATLIGQITRDTAGAVEGKGWLLGGRVPVGAGLIRFSVSQYTTDRGLAADPRTRKMAIGYVHNLSKRTAVYTTYARVRNSGGAAVPVLFGGGTPAINGGASGIDVGIRHSF